MLSKIKKLLKSENNRIVIFNTIFSFFIKGGALILSLLTTPAFINYFNNNVVLGVWYTMLSVLIWFLNFDLGVGNGIRNSLTISISHKDMSETKKVLSSGLCSVCIVTIVLSVTGLVLLSVIDLNDLFNVNSSLISYKTLFISSCFVFIAIMVRFMLTFITSIFYALQKSAINNLIALLVSVLQLLFVVCIRFESVEKALMALSIAYMVISNLPVLVAGIWIFNTELRECKPNIRYIDKQHIKSVLKIGGIFFVCQILYMLIANTNEFFITKLFGPEYTTTYTFYYKVTSLISMVVTLAMTPIWSVVTKAVAEDDWVWISRLYKKIKKIGFLIIISEFCLIPFLQIIMNIWLGINTFEIDYFTAIAFACFGSTFVYSGMLSTIVCGMARMRLQAICYGIGVLFKFIFIILMAKMTNEWSIVVWSNALLLLPYCILQQIDLNKLIVKKIRKLNI